MSPPPSNSSRPTEPQSKHHRPKDDPNKKIRKRVKRLNAKPKPNARPKRTAIFWLKKIEKDLKRPRRTPQSGIFDPRTFFKTQISLGNFYRDGSGVCCLEGLDLNSREKLARSAIDQVLEKYASTEKTKVTTGLCFHNSDSTGSEIKDEADLESSIQIESLNNDTCDFGGDENPQDSSASTRKAKSAQDFSVMSQTLISASPNCLGPPLDPCVQYLKLRKIKDRGDGLSEWASPFLPRINGQGSRKALLDNQVTAVVWILSRFFGKLPVLKALDGPAAVLGNQESAEDKANRRRLAGPEYRGCILADSMGLGKTITTVSVLSLIAEQGLNAIKTGNGTLSYRPMLLLAPNATVAVQWIKEILQNTRKKAFCEVLTSGNGIASALAPEKCAEGSDPRLTVLSPKEFESFKSGEHYAWNEKNKRSSHVILVMPIDTWASRTCIGLGGEGVPKFYKSKLLPSTRRFSVVAVDEAHRVKNRATRLWNSIELLDKRFTLLITATPCMNTLSDLFGLASLMRQAPEEFVKPRPDSISNGLKSLDRLEKLEQSNPLYLIAGHPDILGQLTNNGVNFGFQVDIQDTRKYLQYFERLAIIQRAPTSRIRRDWEGTETVLLNGLFPKVEYSTVSIEPEVPLAKKYQRTHYKLLLKYLRALQMLYMSNKERQQRQDLIEKSKSQQQNDQGHPAGHTGGVGIKVENSGNKRKSFPSAARRIAGELTKAPAIKRGNESGSGPASQGPACQPNKAEDETIEETNVNEDDEEEEPDEKEDDGDTHLTIVYRNFAIAAASLDVYRLQQLFLKHRFSTRAADLAKMRRNGITLIDLEPFLTDKVQGKSSRKRKTFWDILNLAIGRSPILRQILVFIRDNILDREENGRIKKLLITEDIPALAWYYELVLQFLGLRCRVLHSDLVQTQRQELVDDFNSTSDDSCQVLIQMYKVGAAGTNLHHSCSRVLVTTQSHSLRMQGQAVHRVIRFGQNEIVQVCRLQLNNSFHAFQESRQFDKLLPELSTRAQHGTNENLVALLNLMQYESYQAWDSEEAQRLMASKTLLSDKYLQRKAEETEDDSDGLDTFLQGCKSTNKGTHGWAHWGSTKDEKNEAFLLPSTRRDHYDEYKSLMRDEKLNFDHGKNQLRRLLTYSAQNGERAELTYSIKDLAEKHILERALELQIRVQLGTDKLAMLPIPQIQLPYLTQEELDKLAEELDAMKKLEHDIDPKAEADNTGVYTCKTKRETDDKKDIDADGDMSGFVVGDDTVVDMDWDDSDEESEASGSDADMSSGESDNEGDARSEDGDFTTAAGPLNGAMEMEAQGACNDDCNGRMSAPAQTSGSMDLRAAAGAEIKKEPGLDELDRLTPLLQYTHSRVWTGPSGNSADEATSLD